MPMLTGSGFAPPVSIDIPTLDEMYYDPMKARPTGKPPSEQAPAFPPVQHARGALLMAQKKYKKRITPDIRSLCRAYTSEGTRVLASIMRDENVPAMSRVAAIKLLFVRGWRKATKRDHIDVNGEASLLKVVYEIVLLHETREQIEFRDQTPLLELDPADTDDNGSKSTH